MYHIDVAFDTGPKGNMWYSPVSRAGRNYLWLDTMLTERVVLPDIKQLRRWPTERLCTFGNTLAVIGHARQGISWVQALM